MLQFYCHSNLLRRSFCLAIAIAFCRGRLCLVSRPVAFPSDPCTTLSRWIFEILACLFTRLRSLACLALIGAGNRFVVRAVPWLCQRSPFCRQLLCFLTFADNFGNATCLRAPVNIDQQFCPGRKWPFPFAPFLFASSEALSALGCHKLITFDDLYRNAPLKIATLPRSKYRHWQSVARTFCCQKERQCTLSIGNFDSQFHFLNTNRQS